jgi:hypothetical protein
VLPHLQVVAAGFGGSPEPRARRGHAGASAVLAAGAATQICDLESGSFPIAVNQTGGGLRSEEPGENSATYRQSEGSCHRQRRRLTVAEAALPYSATWPRPISTTTASRPARVTQVYRDEESSVSSIIAVPRGDPWGQYGAERSVTKLQIDAERGVAAVLSESVVPGDGGMHSHGAGHASGTVLKQGVCHSGSGRPIVIPADEGALCRSGADR